MMDVFVSQEELLRQVCTGTTSTQSQNYPQDMLIKLLQCIRMNFWAPVFNKDFLPA